MSDINRAIKDAAAPGVIQVIEWARAVHEDTMNVLQGSVEDQIKDQLRPSRFTLYEREEARKILLEYGAGKPTRIVEHRGSNKHPIAFKTTIVGAQPALTEGEPAYIPAEVVNDGNGNG